MIYILNSVTETYKDKDYALVMVSNENTHDFVMTYSFGAIPRLVDTLESV